VVAGELARNFSELRPEFCGEPGLARPPCQTTYAAHAEKGEEEKPGRQKAKAKPRAPRKNIQKIVGRGKFAFVSTFRESPITGLNWGAFFNLAPSIKPDICSQHI